MVMPIDWGEIFARRPDLEPPGQREAAETVKARWAERPKCGKPKRKGKGKEARLTSIKHTNPDP
jgi:hypothetical protein